MTIVPLAVPPDPTGDPTVLTRLAAAAAGDGPLLLPHAADEPPPSSPGPSPLPGGGLALGTSGSSGVAKRAVLSPAALAASADATHDRLGGPGQWLLALPPHHVAGMQVLLRSLRADEIPAVVPPGSFTPAAFTAGVATMTGRRRYTSLVPTQLRRLLDDADATAAAAGLDAILVGGSAVGPDLLDRALRVALPIVLTYGMSETCGGCVYDGLPLDGVDVHLDADSRIHLTGPLLATGYLAPPADDPFVVHEGRRWFRTDDLGRLERGDDGRDRLVISGRVDDVVITGGLKVWPSEVAAALTPALPPGGEVVVVGIPDPEWGHRVAALVELPGVSTTPLRGPDPALRPDVARSRHAPATTAAWSTDAGDVDDGAGTAGSGDADADAEADGDVGRTESNGDAGRSDGPGGPGGPRPTDDPAARVVAALDTRARDVLPRHARPRIVRVVAAMPRVGLGKPDRRRIAELLAATEWDDESSAVPGPVRAPKEG